MYRKRVVITKVENNRVYKIDNKSALDTYAHYLGEETADALPSVGVGFPLIVKRNGIKVARSIVAKHEDGSLSFAGNLHEGDKVRFGYGNPKDLLSQSVDIFNDIQNQSPESIFVYSCMARKYFLQDSIEQEIKPLQSIATTAGFFTYGEFFSGKKNELLNQTMTIISLSESRKENTLVKTSIKRENKSYHMSINALIHLLDKTSLEAQEHKTQKQAQNIFKTVFEESPDGILLMDIHTDSAIECNNELLKMFGYKDKERFLNTSPRNIFPMYQEDGSVSVSKIRNMKDETINRNKLQEEWHVKKEDGTLFWVDLMFSKIKLYNKEVIYVLCRDITKRKQMESELLQQKNKLFHQAYYDVFTKLPNRTFFID